MKNITKFFALCLATFALCATADNASALTIQNGNNINVAKGTAISGILLVTGQDITVDADAPSDLMCAGQKITINGNVDGDVLCAGQDITVNGSVSGSVRVMGQNVAINGAVGRNAIAAGQRITSQSKITGEMIFASQIASLGGEIGKDVAGAASDININGVILGNTSFYGVNSLTLGKSAKLNGSLTYESATDAVLQDGSTVAGQVSRTQPQPQKAGAFGQPQPKKTSQEMLVSKIEGLIFYLVAALLLAFFFKRFVIKITDAMLARAGASFGWGLLLLILTPIAAIVVAITVIGIPVAIIAAMLYIIALFFSRILAAIAVGRVLTRNYWKSKQDSLIAATVLGIALCWLAFAVPAIGGLLSFIAAIWGMGGIRYLASR